MPFRKIYLIKRQAGSMYSIIQCREEIKQTLEYFRPDKDLPRDNTKHHQAVK